MKAENNVEFIEIQHGPEGAEVEMHEHDIQIADRDVNEEIEDQHGRVRGLVQIDGQIGADVHMDEEVMMNY